MVLVGSGKWFWLVLAMVLVGSAMVLVGSDDGLGWFW
jgi:hypothetical protein